MSGLQVPACDRCTQGVMDATNPHLLGTCGCSCHGLHPALDVDDSGRVSLGVAGDQLPIAGTSRAALEGAPCGSPIAAVTDELEPAPEPIPGQLPVSVKAYAVCVAS